MGEEGWWTCPMNSRRCIYRYIYIYIRIQYIQAAFNKCLFMKTVNTSQNSRVHFRLQQKCVSSRKMYKIIISKQDIELGYCVSNLSARSYTHIRNTYRIITKKANISLMRCRGHSHTFSFRCINITFDIVYGFVDFVLFSWCYILRYHWDGDRRIINEKKKKCARCLHLTTFGYKTDEQLKKGAWELFFFFFGCNV